MLRCLKFLNSGPYAASSICLDLEEKDKKNSNNNTRYSNNSDKTMDITVAMMKITIIRILILMEKGITIIIVMNHCKRTRFIAPCTVLARL